MVLAAPGKLLIDFGLRRAHGGRCRPVGCARQLYCGLCRHDGGFGREDVRHPYLRTIAHSFSDSLDEEELARFAREGAPIDGFGIGTSLTTSSDAPALDCAYKLQEYAGLARRKRSAGKATWPGRKQMWRRYGADGRMAGEVLSVEDDQKPGERLLHLVTRGGRRLNPSPALSEIRAHARRELERLPEPLRRLAPHASYPVEVSDRLLKLAAEVDRRLALRETT